ncbi:hypothetical protein [Hahella ganghwensis]|uniref:hypothetical protein n=1 Tax=Hahella ganghwensis TaxID=286420 RepID=UPI00037C8C83|nr:hypothetical protein [Hahella ganghwensis]
MKKLKLMLAVALMLVATGSYAQLAGENVILIQGFLPWHIPLPPSDNGQSDGIAYWDGFDSAIKDSPSTKILYWPSNKRLPGAGGIAELIATQLQPILSSGHCDNDCIIITHSTGDLVMRYVIANKMSLLGSTLANRFKVAAVIDMAGAGGGTELANYGVDVINGVNHGADILETLLEFLGYDLEIGMNPGVAIDLQPSVARNTAVNNIPAIPRLRIAATGNELYGFATHPLIKGSDDSVVPLHSACGAAYDGSFDSCVQDLRIDGRVTSVSKAPSLNQLYNYHYPLIMSEKMAHNEMQANKDGRDMTFALSGADHYNSSLAKTIGVDVEYHTVYAWWDWFREYRYITNADDKTMGRVILDSFE